MIAESGPEGGILITNVVGQEWLSYQSPVGLRPDLIRLEAPGRADGRTEVDCAVSAGVGFPLAAANPLLIDGTP